jgi:type VI secretion system protein ImpJ
MRGLARRRLSRDERATYSAGDDTAMFVVALDTTWFDPAQPLHIDVGAGVRGAAPWAVQLFTPAGEVNDPSGEAGRGANE